jgi:hypothetical protein
MKTQKRGWNVGLLPLLQHSAQAGRWSCQLYAPIPLLLNTDRRNRSLENYETPYRYSNPEPPTLWCRASTNCDTACFVFYVKLRYSISAERGCSKLQIAKHNTRSDQIQCQFHTLPNPSKLIVIQPLVSFLVVQVVVFLYPTLPPAQPIVASFTTSFHGSATPSGPRPPHCRRFTITLRHTTLGGISLDTWSAWRRDFYKTLYNTHKRQTSITRRH